MTFTPAEPQADFVALEKEVLAFWQKQSIFQKSINARPREAMYTFYDGPPFATGLPHYGHLLASTIKDVIPRYWTMKGKHIERRFGWDCHGLPVEY
jgi:isoleucyl-tRNA synthetase